MLARIRFQCYLEWSPSGPNPATPVFFVAVNEGSAFGFAADTSPAVAFPSSFLAPGTGRLVGLGAAPPLRSVS